MKNSKNLLLGVLVLFILVTLTACGKEHKPAEDAKLFKVGMECGYAPYNCT